MTPTPPGEPPGEPQEQEQPAVDSTSERNAGETDLFEEFLEQRDRGAGSVLDLLQQSADPDMQERVNLLGALEQLSTLLSGSPEGELPDLEHLGRFDDLRILGEGGLSRVFAGYDPRLDREVALKVLNPGGFDVASAHDWMLSEGRSLAKLEHPCVVEVFEVGEAEGHPYIAMERVDGPTLQSVLDYMRRDSAAPADESPAAEVVQMAERLGPIAARLRLALDLAEAISECHRQGVVHRDVKPGNVLLPATGRPKLIDFGLAHLEGGSGSIGLTQRLVGTPGYVAPEQVDEERTGSSPLSDQFSFSVVLYELIAREHPFRRETKAETMSAVSRALPTPPRKLLPSIPVDVERIVLHGLQRDPQHRYPNMSALAEDLRAFLDYRPISLRAPSVLRRIRLWAQRNDRAMRGSLVTAGVLALLLTGVLLNGLREDVQDWEEKFSRALESVPELQTPNDLRLALNRNFELSTEAKDLDEHPLRFRSKRLAQGMQELEQTMAERLRELVTRDRDPTRHRTLLARIHHQYQADRKWGEALILEHNHAPSIDHNDDLRQVGLVQLPDNSAIWRYEERSELLSRLVAADIVPALLPGTYRVRSPLPTGGFGEAEFLVTGLEPRRSITPRALPAELAKRMLEVTGRDLDPARMEDGKGIYTVPDFLILPDAITWAELGKVLGDDPYERAKLHWEKELLMVDESELQPRGRAMPTLLEAVEYANAMGCRLATPMEYALAIEQKILPVEGVRDFSSMHPSAEGQLGFRTLGTQELLALLETRGVWTDKSWMTEDLPDDALLGVAEFRLVRTSALDE